MSLLLLQCNTKEVKKPNCNDITTLTAHVLEIYIHCLLKQTEVCNISIHPGVLGSLRKIVSALQ
jgi:hypothetical protein